MEKLTDLEALDGRRIRKAKRQARIELSTKEAIAEELQRVEEFIEEHILTGEKYSEYVTDYYIYIINMKKRGARRWK